MRHSDSKLTRVRGAQPVVRDAARQLRREMTEAERLLWEALRDRRLAGLKFRRDHPVGRFVLDFFCSAAKLAVEVDGSSHDGRVEEDAARTAALHAYGYEVARFRNERAKANLPNVLAEIRSTAHRRIRVGVRGSAGE